MLPARPASAPQPFVGLADEGDAEFSRALRFCDPGPALDGPVTFLPPVAATADEWLRAWGSWRDDVLATRLAGALVQTAALAGRGCAREIFELAGMLDTALDPIASERSVAAGRRLLGRLSSSRGEKIVARLQRSDGAGECRAHFPVVYAVQHALFHLPLRLLVPAYAYWEWTAAMSVTPVAGGPVPDFTQEAERLTRLAGELLPSLPSSHAVDDFPAAAGDR